MRALIILAILYSTSASHAQGLLSTQPLNPPQKPPKVLQGTQPKNQPRVVPSNPIAVATALAQLGKLPEALKTLDTALESSPKNRELRTARASVRQAAGLLDLAKQDYDDLVTSDPKDSRAWHQRGWLHLVLGHPTNAVADFDKALELVPAQKPYDWQRGIACYYANQFEEGRRQFEIHQTVNSQDVENAVWHFLCVAKTDGVEKARKLLINITADPRVPLQEVQALFAGTGKPEAVLQAAKDRSGSRSKESHFYAHLYLGLYFEALGNTEKSAEHILLATTEYNLPGLMGDVARTHRLLRKIVPPQAK